MHATEAKDVTDSTYIAFLVLTFVGALLAWTLVDAKDVIRDDGSKIIVMKHPSWQSEIMGLWETFFTDPYIIALFPMFLSSNWFYAYHFTELNHGFFNLRTRSLNNVIYYLFQIIGAYVFGFALDFKGIRRSLRAKIAWVVLLSLVMVIWGCGYSFQKTFTREFATDKTAKKKDWSDSGYGGPFTLYIFYGFFDAAWQTCVYWYAFIFVLPFFLSVQRRTNKVQGSWAH